MKQDIEFIHKITKEEVKSQYLNLKDLGGSRYGDAFPERGAPLLIIDPNSNKEFKAVMHKHNRHQIWGLKTWFKHNNIMPGTQIRIRYGPNEPPRYDPKRGEKRYVVYFEVLSRPEQTDGETKTVEQKERLQDSHFLITVYIQKYCQYSSTKNKSSSTAHPEQGKHGLLKNS